MFENRNETKIYILFKILQAVAKNFRSAANLRFPFSSNKSNGVSPLLGLLTQSLYPGHCFASQFYVRESFGDWYIEIFKTYSARENIKEKKKFNNINCRAEARALLHNSVYEITVTCRRVHGDAHDWNYAFSHYCIMNVWNVKIFEVESEECNPKVENV